MNYILYIICFKKSKFFGPKGLPFGFLKFLKFLFDEIDYVLFLSFLAFKITYKGAGEKSKRIL